MGVKGRRSGEPSGDNVVTFNPVVLFLLIFITPYILFVVTVMAVTGRTDIMLIYESVIANSDSVYFKAWMIGTFVLAILGSLFFSGRRTKQYLVEQFDEKRSATAVQGGSVETETHYKIEHSYEESSPVLGGPPWKQNSSARAPRPTASDRAEGE